jgi:simple sugar transport system permease protein
MMEQAILVSFVLSVMTASTPLLLAATGELVTEKSGVLNLGVEGMMLVGAIVGFATTVHSGSVLLGVLTAMLAGMAMALIFAILTLTFLANQVATGLALTIFGTGLSALVGSSYVGTAVEAMPKLHVPVLSDIPLIGPIAFGQDALIYLSLLAVFGVAWFLRRSHRGLVLRAVGDSHDAAHAIGYPVILIRYAATLFGGAMCGLAGAYMSLAYSTSWAENMTAGRGWIALALVVFATWRPVWLLVGAYLFGGIMYGSLAIQAANPITIFEYQINVPAQVVLALPYLVTILVLVVISRDKVKIRLNAPACLGRPFHAAG